MKIFDFENPFPHVYSGFIRIMENLESREIYFKFQAWKVMETQGKAICFREKKQKDKKKNWKNNIRVSNNL